jgi:VWFA-related protein
MHRTFLSLLLICQLVQAVVGQQDAKPQPSPTPQNPPVVQEPNTVDAQDVVKITTNLVQVDAVVTDKNGRRVIDLKPEEIELSEDGKVRNISNFAYINLDSSTSRPLARTPSTNPRDTLAPPLVPRALQPGQVRRTLALVVDDLGLSFESSVHVRNSLKKFLDEQLQPDDLVAIIRTSGGIGALQSFTTDRRQLYAAVEKVKWSLIGRGEAPFMNAAGMLRRENPRTGVSSVESIDAEKHLNQMRRDMFTVGTLGALHYVIKGLQSLPGRKSVVLFSDGFKIPRGDFFENDQIVDILRELTDFANRAAVVIYTIDARGLQTLGLAAGDSTTAFNSDQVASQLAERKTSLIETQQGLGFLSALTGGLAIRNNNDLNLGIQKILDDQKGYYLIGYRPDESTFATVDGKAKFHHISLRIKREGSYSVRTRNSFYGRTDETASPKLTAKQQLEDALTSPFTSSDIQVKLTSIFANNIANGSLLQSFLHVRASDLTFATEADGSRKASFNLAAVTFGDNGKVLDQFGYPVSITVPANEFERINKDGFVYSLGIPIKKPGAYQLRMAIRDETTERIGSAMQFVEVPDLQKKKLTVSGILLSGIPLAKYLNGSAGPSATQNLEGANLEADPNANAAVRIFKGEQALIYAFNIYNARINKKTGKAQLKTRLRLYRDGQLIFTGDEVAFSPVDDKDPQRLLGAGVVQLRSGMTIGGYAIQLVVTDVLDKEKVTVASQWIDFDVVN